jgi:hypothetical protein
MISPEEAFDDLGGRFLAKLKSLKTHRKTYEGKYETFSNTATLEAKFDLKVFERLHEPAFIAIERPTVGKRRYSIYEVVGINPMHYQMLGVESSIPLQIREEFLARVGESWGESEETWIDITAIQTDYALVEKDGYMEFERQKLIPLVGSRAHLLSSKTVKELLCVDDGIEVGRMLGFEIPLTVNPDDLIKYHVGVFGFTGVGKSNLTAVILRKLIKKDPELKVIIFDVSGEYTVHLLDLMDEAHFYTTETFDDMNSLVASQVVPESLEARLEDVGLKKTFEKMQREGRFGLIELASRDLSFTLRSLYEILERVISERKSGHMWALTVLRELRNRFSDLSDTIELSEVIKDDEDREFLFAEIDKLIGNVKYAGFMQDIAAIKEYLSSPITPKEEESEAITPEQLASDTLYDDRLKVLIVYLPDPDQARMVVSRYLNMFLYLKKKKGVRVKTLTVLDEAQEFIPSDMRGTASMSNKSVEALLRQGRKYRSYAWISTQRVAHLNTNALQQLHSYFVSTLPRMYDRMVIADAFSLDYGIVEKVTELSTGEWLFVSYKATKQKNVPVFIRTENNEDFIVNSQTSKS